MKKALVSGMAVAMLVMGSLAHASEEADKAIEYRQNVFNVIKWHFGPMGGMVKGKVDFDAADFARRAELVAALAKMPAEGFGEGTDMGDTRAKAEIWQNKAKFDEGMSLMAERAAALAEVAKAGDMNTIKPAFGELAKTCKGCHDNFREEQ